MKLRTVVHASKVSAAFRAGRMMALVGLLLFGSMAAALAQPHWPQFRGLHGGGVSTNGDFPVVFGPQSNVLWQTEISPGYSSPCIWSNRLFLTGTQGDQLETLCLSATDGAILWRKTVRPEKLEKGTGGSASPTPVTDGTLVCAYFGPFGLVAYDFVGNERWRKPLPTPITQHGTGSSPVMSDRWILVSRDQDVGAHLLAVDKRDGQTVWQSERPDCRRGFATPLLYPPDNPSLVILPGSLRLFAYNLADGTERWRAGGLPNEMVATPVGGEGLIFAAGWTPGANGVPLVPFDNLLAQGDQNQDSKLTRDEAPSGPAKRDFPYIDANKDGFISRAEWESTKAIFERSDNALVAIRPNGTGDVTRTHTAWKQKRGMPYVPSPLYYQGHLYLVKNGGLISCFEAATGKPCYQEERLGAMGDYYASPVAAAGKILVCSQAGIATVLRAGPALEVLARNQLGEKLMATPAIIGATLYLRTATKVYAFRAPLANRP